MEQGSDKRREGDEGGAASFSLFRGLELPFLGLRQFTLEGIPFLPRRCSRDSYALGNMRRQGSFWY